VSHIYPHIKKASIIIIVTENTYLAVVEIFLGAIALRFKERMKADTKNEFR
jgi:hypothetical protein